MPILQNTISEIYLKVLLDQMLIHYEMGELLLVTDDNLGHIVQEEFRCQLEQGNITWLAWLANSPDINPVENMWDLVARAIRNKINPTPTKEQ